MIRGMWYAERDRLHPEQWVNVWAIDCACEARYFETYQVKELDSLAQDGDWGLEPVDGDGQPMAVKVALERGQLQ
jgi:hypothetical protein